jgi:phospholipid-translocating ATPase
LVNQQEEEEETTGRLGDLN